MKRVVLTGGASGGHAFPLVAIGQAIQAEATRRGESVELLALGKRGFLDRAASAAGFPFRALVAGGLRRYVSWRIPFDLLKFPISLLQSAWYLFWFMPDVVVSKGGFDAVAPSFIARLFFIPVVTHESDSLPGLANRVIARVARVVCLGYPQAARYFNARKTVVTGNPIRPEIGRGSLEQARTTFSLTPSRKTILILGGSQGAQEINAIILNSLVPLTEQYQIIHQCGTANHTALRAAVDQIIKEGTNSYGSNIQNFYHLVPFLDIEQLAQAYAAADLVISRAGANSLAEIAQVAKPTIVIPLAFASHGEQLANAAVFAQYGAVIVEGANITTHILLDQIAQVLDSKTATQISAKLKTIATPQAASDIAAIVWTLMA